MKNVFQELVESANKEDQADCETEDLEESSSRRNRSFKIRSLFWIYPLNTSYDGG